MKDFRSWTRPTDNNYNISRPGAARFIFRWRPRFYIFARYVPVEMSTRLCPAEMSRTMLLQEWNLGDSKWWFMFDRELCRISFLACLPASLLEVIYHLLSAFPATCDVSKYWCILGEDFWPNPANINYPAGWFTHNFRIYNAGCAENEGRLNNLQTAGSFFSWSN